MWMLSASRRSRWLVADRLIPRQRCSWVSVRLYGLGTLTRPEGAGWEDRPAPCPIRVPSSRTQSIPRCPMNLHASILDTIGGTPVVRLNRLAPAHVELYAKVESFNPGGSVK